ncbi:malto-oligosyltrehalose synthase [Ornithinimicrobium ciconiae]|uniref:Malto-oligosyltrehalose synthase n=1 Tax=Ornithinimicrobium ciconiae TaxID=2594265 RepID=A0A516G7V7_9MICO|nr:malto-oligosyltrehalose synthase [Ornithinimicrobium ciconiae]QDO87617.1 malto-oligosyltrehalose synthase [Ornithinimicrobium ciconiae]
MLPPAPASTYRLQLHAGFTFDDAREVVPYLRELGVTHAYLSPVLTAVPGSQHGYDVLDHQTIDPQLGGREGLERLAAACHEAGLGVVVDIVPNHMALTAPEWANAQVWQVLRQGRRAPTAHWFDVDWEALDGRFGLPVLGAPLGEVLAAGELVLDTGREDEGPAAGQPVIRYYEHVFPVAEGTGSDDVAQVLARQHYVLAHWREAEAVLNYRRFFEVDSLIGVRVEDVDVFEESHRLLLELNHSGVIDAFRVDHPDGLADPEDYLRRLTRQSLPGTPVWVEKILEGDERLPDSWECSGTTGYDANATLQRALTPVSSAGAVDAAWQQIGGTPSLEEVVTEAKQGAVARLLTPETARLLRLARRALPDDDAQDLRAALADLLVAVDVYRAYVRPGHETDPASVRRLHAAVERAVASPAAVPEQSRALGEVLADPDTSRDPVAARDLAVRFQQVTGPVMAKGIEDTAFYRWHRLTALNEVGADPAAAPGVAALNDWARHQVQHWPLGMTTLSTHDTKRSEDVRARLLAVAADAAAWQACTDAFSAAAAEHGVDGPTAHLVWQTVVGAGGQRGTGHELDEQRLTDYLVKAMREGKEHTDWVAVDEDYEHRVLGLARAALADAPLREVTDAAVAANDGRVRAVILAQKLLQLTLPGVPDTYQGCELVNLSLVDPDNRRDVDFADRVSRLASLDAGQAPRDLSDEKLLVTATVLRLRRDQPESFTGGYEPLDVDEALLGYRRGDDVMVLAARQPDADGGVPSTPVELPPGAWVDRLTGTHHEGRVSSDALLDTLPVALLVRT